MDISAACSASVWWLVMQLSDTQVRQDSRQLSRMALLTGWLAGALADAVHVFDYMHDTLSNPIHPLETCI